MILFLEKKMLKDLLNVLGEGKLYSISELAKRLDVSEGLLMQMMEDLSRRGYLTISSGNSCTVGGGSCGSYGFGCSSCSSCASIQNPGLNGWALTEKGRRATQKASVS
jgi:hypothetical protein